MGRARLEQHFLWDERILERIAASAGVGPDDCVVEIGAGDGRLTVYLAEHAKLVYAVEVDPAMTRMLKERFQEDPVVRVVHADFMKMDLAALISPESRLVCARTGQEPQADPESCAQPKPLLQQDSELRAQPEPLLQGRAVFVGNIPYYITTPIIELLVENRDLVRSATLTMQAEVAQRITVQPGADGCGAISAYVSYHFRAERLFDISPRAFSPPPKVNSAVVSLTPRAAPPVDAHDPDLMFMIIRTAFQQARKKAVNVVANAECMGGMEKAALGRIFEVAGVDHNARAEHITLEQYAAVGNAVRMAWDAGSEGS